MTNFTYLFQVCRNRKCLITATRPQPVIDNERCERQFFAFRLLAQLATQRSKGHRINTATDGEAFLFGQLICSALRWLDMCFVSYQCEALRACRTIVAEDQLSADQQLTPQLATIRMSL
jgi:hypothetical protein